MLYRRPSFPQRPGTIVPEAAAQDTPTNAASKYRELMKSPRVTEGMREALTRLMAAQASMTPR